MDATIIVLATITICCCMTLVHVDVIIHITKYKDYINIIMKLMMSLFAFQSTKLLA